MVPSKHNLLTRVHDDQQWLLVNLLAGQADLLEPELGERLARGEWPEGGELAEKGYLVDPAEEARRYREAYLAFVDNRAQDEVQLFYVPTYACNFACSYCFQDEYAPAPHQGDQQAVIDAFFAYVDDTFADRRKYITIFGGEPLLTGKGARRVIETLIAGANARGLDIAIVTNGHSLVEYVPLLQTARIRELQVTLDGVGAVHDARRHLKGGGATFDKVVAGVDAALAAGLRVNLRMVVDKDNVDDFATLAHFAIDRGWTDNPGFKTQLGRNYELHHCQTRGARLYSRLSMYEDLYRLAKADPEILRFHAPGYSVSHFLFDKGELPPPLFDSCPACKTEWAFDYTGTIYPCTANVGKAGEAVGRYWPERSLDTTRTEPWQERDVLAMAACRSCNAQLACGGGCGAVSKNQGGTVDTPDCRPIAPLLSLGCALYGQASLTP